MRLDKYYHLYGRKDDMVFEEVPVPEQRWIPVTERLPEHEKYVLVTDSDGDVEIASMEFIWEGDNEGYAWWLHDIGHIEVTAWMPLPSPYKEKE